MPTVGFHASHEQSSPLLATTDPVRPLEGPAFDLKLEGFGYRWYRLQRRGTNTTP